MLTCGDHQNCCAALSSSLSARGKSFQLKGVLRFVLAGAAARAAAPLARVSLRRILLGAEFPDLAPQQILDLAVLGEFLSGAAACAGVSSPSCPHAPLRGPRELQAPALFFRPRRAPPTPSSADSVFGKPRKGFFFPGRFRRNLGTFSRRNIFLEKMFFFLLVAKKFLLRGNIFIKKSAPFSPPF